MVKLQRVVSWQLGSVEINASIIRDDNSKIEGTLHLAVYKPHKNEH